MTDDLEKVAEVIHGAMRFDRESATSRWVGGNSDAEEHARVAARKAVEALINGVELEWKAVWGGPEAQTPFGWYAVEEEIGRFWCMWSFDDERHTASTGTMKAAKALCLEDYRNRLRKALGVEQ